MLRTATTKAKQISVGIVGAGFAGLRCADVLLRHGCKVTIIEARNRLGGRVAQSQHLGHLTDLGPNWIHGTTNNPIMDLADKTGTKLHDWAELGVVFGTDGERLSTEDALKFVELLWDDGLISSAFQYSNEHTKTLDPQISLYDFFEEKSKSFFADETPDIAARKREQFLHFCYMYSFYIGSPMTRQSLKFFWLEECIGGENPYVAETYHKILEAVSRPAEQGAHIILDTEVVAYISNEVSDGSADSHDTPSIVTADGATLSFDEIVITVPLGCLKQTKSAFKPELPHRLSQAIDNIGYGHLDKVYLTFPSAFWDVPSKGAASTLKGADPSSNINSNHTLIAPTAAAPVTTLPTTGTAPPLPVSENSEQHFASFVHFLQPAYAQQTNPDGWMQEMVNLAALRSDCAHPTLLFYIQGSHSKYIADVVARAKSDEERDASLIEFFEPYFSRLPNYDKADAACTPTAVLATAWANDKFAGYGSYSNFPIGLAEADKDIEAMRHGMPERGLWMAGEHTAPFIALGTSTGAYWSGEHVAKRIAEAHNLELKDG